MGIFSRFFKEFDMFVAPATLRAREQPQVSNVCAGVLSFLLACLFAYVFINSAVGIITFKKIEYKSAQTFVTPSQNFSSTEIMYGIKIPTVYPVQQQFFYFYMTVNDTNHDLVPCTEDHWSGLSNNLTYVSQQYKEYELSRYLCPPRGLILENEEGTKHNYINHQLRVQFCDTWKSDKCYSITDVIAQLSSSVQFQKYANVEIIILDTGFTPSQENSTIKFLNSDLWFTFSTNNGATGRIDISRYQIQTDNSLFPVEQKQKKVGIFVDKTKIMVFDRTGDQQVIQIDISLNAKKLIIERVIGKFDEILSYAGGLFSIIIGFLAFFMASFNEYRYELMIAEGAFAYDVKGKKIREKNFHFFRYIKYSIYDWINTLFCTQLNWESCRQIDSTRQEANKQIDVTHLFRRISHLQNCLSQVLEKNKKTCLHLMGSESMTSAKRKRMISEYYEWIIKENDNVITQNDAKILKQIASNAGLKDFQQQYNQSTIKSSEIADSSMIQISSLQQEAFSVELDEEQIQIEQQIAKQFNSLPIQFRQKLQKNVPLKILYRLKNNKSVYNKNETSEMINL